MLRIVLEAGRFRVFWSRNLVEGLAETLESRPDAIILDLNLPDCDGYGALEALREWTNAPGLILTGRGSMSASSGRFGGPPRPARSTTFRSTSPACAGSWRRGGRTSSSGAGKAWATASRSRRNMHTPQS